MTAPSARTDTPSIAPLLARVRACDACAAHLPLGPRPVLQAHEAAPVLIASQAPGRLAHERGLPFDDPSGDRLRGWLGVTREQFYDPRRFAIVPVGFCFPGSGPSGDLPPRPECRALWHAPLLDALAGRRLSLLIGAHAMREHLAARPTQGARPPVWRGSVTSSVAAWRELAPEVIPLPHPSGRNNRWLASNPWFEAELLPALQTAVTRLVE